MLKTTMSLIGITGLGASVALAAITGFPITKVTTNPTATVTQDRDEHDGDKDDEDDDDGDQESKEKTVKLDDLPAAAVAAIKKAAGKNEITGVTSEKVSGAKIFEAAWKVDGMDREIVVAANGTIMERERTIALEDAPDAVQRMAKKAFPKGTTVVVEKKTMIFYTVEAKQGNEEHEILLTGTGQPVKVEAVRQKHESDGDDEEDDEDDDEDDDDHDGDNDDDGGDND